MRCAVLLPLVPAFAATGCSVLIAGAGRDLSQIESKKDAHKLLGEPTCIGTENGCPVEEFHSRWKYREAIRANSMVWGAFLTLGLSELYSLPVEVVRIGRRAAFGQTIRVIYDENGTAVRATIEGCPIYPSPGKREPSSTSPDWMAPTRTGN